MPTPDPSPSTQNSQPSTNPQPSYRPKGKIAWGPKAVRDKINQLLLEGLSYPAILTTLGPDGEGLNVNSIWRYHKGQFRHWLREQYWLAQARIKEEAAAEHCRGLEAVSGR